MTAQQLYDKVILPEAKYWLKELEYYGENQFKKKTEASDWTIGQVYEHVSFDILNLHMQSIERCLDKGAGGSGRKTMLGIAVFLFGTMFSIKYKSLPKTYTPSQPESLVKAKDKLYRFLKEMQRMASQIDKTGKQAGKVKHPKFGFLDAHEWYKLTIMHMMHHRKQKQRIDEILRRSPKEAFGEDI